MEWQGSDGYFLAPIERNFDSVKRLVGFCVWHESLSEEQKKIVDPLFDIDMDRACHRLPATDKPTPLLDLSLSGAPQDGQT